MPTAAVIGANSGIGHAFATLLIGEGYKVYAGDVVVGDGLQGLASRGAAVHEIDVSSPQSIAKFKSKIGDEPIDLLLHIAGIARPPEQDNLEATNFELLQKMFAINSIGPLLTIQALLPNVLKSTSTHPKIGIMTSRVGSIGDNSSGGMYAYRASKAAANQISKNLAVDPVLKERGVVVMALHPGFVRSGLMPGLDGPDFVDPEEAATKLWRNVVKEREFAGTGKFWHREGYELIW